MEEIKYSGNFVKVTEETIDGLIWERAYLGDGVMVFPITNEGKIVLISEKRPHEKNPIRLKFVTGLIDPGEEPEDAANREMQEEIGFKAKTLIPHLKRESSGTINTTLHQFIAKDLEVSKLPNPDGDMILEIKEYSLSEIFDLINSGKLPWSMGALGLYKLRDEQEGLLN